MNLFAFLGKLVVGLFNVAYAAAPYIAVAAGSMALSQSQAKKAESQARRGTQAAAEVQAKAAARARAVANAPVTAEQMGLIIQQREIGSLVQQYIDEEQQGPRVYTLPKAEPSSPVTQINQAIHKLLAGA